MILSVFYSKILKDAIASFDRERDLNSSVINHLDRYIIASPAVIGILLIYIWGKYDFWVTSVMLFVCGVMTYKVVIEWITRSFILPYSLGQTLEGDVLQAEQGWNMSPGSPSGLRIIYQFRSQTGKNIKKRYGIIIDAEQKNMPSTDSGKIVIYEFIHNGKSYHAPFVPEYFKKTCLSKRRIQSEINH